MGVFEMVVAIVFIATAGKVAQAFARSRSAAGPDARVPALEEALRTTELRLAQTEERVGELSEKLTFVENLLSAPETPAQLPPRPR
jgi:hypothetical protein